jgi:hypothetical protein
MYALLVAIVGTLALGQQGSIVKQTQLPPPQQQKSANSVMHGSAQAQDDTQTKAAKTEKPAPAPDQEIEKAEPVKAQAGPAVPAQEVKAPAPAAADTSHQKKASSGKRIAAFWLMLPRT